MEPLDVDAMGVEIDIADPPDEPLLGDSGRLVHIVAHHARSAIAELRELRAELAEWRGLIHPATDAPPNNGDAEMMLAVKGHYYTAREPIAHLLRCDYESSNCEYPNGYPIAPRQWSDDIKGFIHESTLIALAERVLTKPSEQQKMGTKRKLNHDKRSIA